ncbi:hypothetical protein MASR1M45_03220 [Candidatus Kapaibacterium sp.]
MKSKIKILLMVLAYVLNFAHELQPHEHHLAECCETIFTSVIKHTQSNQTDHHNHDNEADEHENGHKDHSLPFPHSHYFQQGGYVQIRIIQTSIIISDISETFDTTYCFRPPEPILIEIIQPDEKNFYQICIGSSLSLRAPPVLS